MIADLVGGIVDFIAAHGEWAGPIVLVLAFGESLAFLSLLFPATAALLAAGALAGAGALDVWVLIVWAIPGAILGDVLSYWIGRRFRFAVPRIWPFSRHPELLIVGERFFERRGTLGVFIGKFFGPLRAAVPLVAGMMDMRPWKFLAAAVASSIVWAPALLLPGQAIGMGLAELSKRGDLAVALGIAAAGALLAGGFWLWRQRRSDRWPFRRPDGAGR